MTHWGQNQFKVGLQMLFVCFKGSRHWYAYFARQIKSVFAVVHRNYRTAPTFSASLAIPALLWSSSYIMTYWVQNQFGVAITNYIS